MRPRPAAVLLFTIVSALVTAVPARSVQAAGPPPCQADSVARGVAYTRCDLHPATGPRGSIGLLGDSVLKGSADKESSPGLATLLTRDGWGPVTLQAVLGMHTSYADPRHQAISAEHWVQRWHAAGWYPDVVGLNLGSAHLGGECSADPGPAGTTAPTCRSLVEHLLRVIGPTATVWWAKITHIRGLPNYQNVLIWNAALDAAARAHHNLVVWDWPAALAASDPPIAMDNFGIHAASPSDYERRSRLMAAHIDTFTPAHRGGHAVALPVASGGPLRYRPFRPTSPDSGVVYDTRTLHRPLAAGVVRSIDARASGLVDGGAAAVALTVNVLDPVTSGSITFYECGTPRPNVAGLTFTGHHTRAGQAISRLSRTGTLCVWSSAAAHLVLTLQGSFGRTYPDRLMPIHSQRFVLTGSAVTPLHVHGGAAATASLTVRAGMAGGTVALHACNSPTPSTVQIRFSAGESQTSAAYVPLSSDATICVALRLFGPLTPASYPTVTVGVNGVFTAGPGLGFVPVTPTRLLDTRHAMGGWYGRHVARQVIDVPAVPSTAKAVTGALTTVDSLGVLTEQAYQCGTAPTTNDALRTKAGVTATNSLTVPLGAPGMPPTLCLRTSQNTHTVFDLVGWWAAAA